MKKNWPILVILYVKSIFFLSHVMFNLTMEWTPRVKKVHKETHIHTETLNIIIL